MKTLWLDCSVAAAGDMILGALLDAGADLQAVLDGLNTLPISGWKLTVKEVTRQGFRAKQAVVTVDGQREAGGPDDGHQHHDHSSHNHRRYSELRAMLTKADLPPRALERTLLIFDRLAQAEAEVHGSSIEDVVLHEVGATDAVVDIVGVALALESLDIEEISSTPLPMATGSIVSAHGRIPLPAPATLALVKGFEVTPAPGPGEWVTPTGAAIVTALSACRDFPKMKIMATGVGAGSKDPATVPNLVRVAVGQQELRPSTDSVVLIEANIDDMTGELLAEIPNSLLDAGALDVWFTPIQMKKGRPAITLHALVKPADSDHVSTLILRHTTTIGLRLTPQHRHILERWFETVQTPYGEITIKVSGQNGVAWHRKPEFESVKEAAKRTGAALQDVFSSALARCAPIADD